MNYQDALNYIHGTYQFGKKLGLENMQDLLHKLGNPQDSLKIIHVAGTNGKGSVCSFLAQILTEAGFSVGLFTSPYLERFNERIRLTGEEIADDELARHTCIVKEKIEAMIEEGRHQPSEFEVVTAIAFSYYAEKMPDFLILEVGLGGRLDATNAITSPVLSIITSIGMDHTQYLGNTLTEIAKEKAGIIKPHVPVLVYPQDHEVESVIAEIAREKSAPYLQLDPDGIKILERSFSGQIVKFKELPDTPLLISLLGEYQGMNAYVAFQGMKALMNYDVLNLTDGTLEQSVKNGLRKTLWAGRMEILGVKPLILIDGAHNQQAGETLVKSVFQLFPGRKITLLFGMLNDKDIKGFVETILPLADKVVLTKPFGPRAAHPRELKVYFESRTDEIHIKPSVERAIDLSLEHTNPEDLLVIAGSLYLIGEARTYLKKRLNKTGCL